MSSSWGDKLETKLSGMTETSSPETLAKWVGFNRKHAKAFAAAFRRALSKSSPDRQAMYLSVIHEVLILEKNGDGAKWNKLADLRSTLGETVILPVLEEAGPEAPWADKVQGMLKEWDSLNVFGGPTMIHQMRKLLLPSGKSAAFSPVAAPSERKAPPAESSSPKEAPKEEAKETAKEGLDSLLGDHKKEKEEKKPEKNKDISPSQPEVTYDFEATGIPAADIKPSDFLGPCRDVATMQISRDLNSDGAVQLSSLLSALPEQIREECAKAAEAEDDYGELDEETARAFSLKTNEVLIDMDLDEQQQNINNFREIVERQTVARKQLIELLIKSRCNFGADEAAAAFYEAEQVEKELKKRKQILIDAMELEGLDVDEDKLQANATETEELSPLSWYKPKGSEDSKRTRIE